MMQEGCLRCLEEAFSTFVNSIDDRNRLEEGACSQSIDGYRICGSGQSIVYSLFIGGGV